MSVPRADLVVRHAKIWSEGRLLPGADAIALAGGRILAVGRAADFGEAAETVDARGATVTPGLTDAHLHLLAWARALDELDLIDAAGPADVGRRVGAALARPHAGAIVGRGWDEDRWTEQPHRAALDAVAPDVPVLLHRHDFHALWVNGEALRRAGVTRATPDPEGGVIERDAAGEPTGVLRENAVRLVGHLAPVPSVASDRARLAAATARLHAQGVTGVHVFEGGRSRRLLRELAAGEKGLRVLMHLPHASLEAAIRAGVRSGAGDARFRIGAIKLFADGTLGSRTASLLAPYADTGSTGMELIPAAELRRLVARAAGHGLATAIHAIGDRAVRAALDAFAAAGETRGLPFPGRIEHVQLLDPADLPRFAALGVAASLQPTHAITDRPVVERAWPDRVDRAYPWRTIFATGALVAFGSDAPVEPADAPRALHAAVTRTDVGGRPAGGWTAHERVSLDQALTASTEGPARLAGNWPALGRLAAGAEADLVVWDRDLHGAASETLHEARPALTLLAGRVVYAEGGSAGREALAPVARGEAA